MRKPFMVETMSWFSFGLVTLMATEEITASEKVQGGMVVFMLPLNSGLRPLLYLWTLVTQKGPGRHGGVHVASELWPPSASVSVDTSDSERSREAWWCSCCL
ncbi:hypothetical protein ACOMHN_066741 [Nucella lapillus]